MAGASVADKGENQKQWQSDGMARARSYLSPLVLLPGDWSDVVRPVGGG